MWKIELLNSEVRNELSSLPRDQQAKFTWIADLIKEHGLENVREPYVKYLENGLWEIRVKGRDGISRAIFVSAKPKRVVVVRVFRKKTQKTPRREINLALKRAEEMMKDPTFVAEYDALAEEFEVAGALIRARSQAGMTQADVAKRMNVTQSRIAKMESGINVSIDALKRYAEATGTKLNISLDATG